MLECHSDGYVCVLHCGKRFANKKYLNAHLTRVREKDSKRNKQLFIFNQDSVNLSGSVEGHDICTPNNNSKTPTKGANSSEKMMDIQKRIKLDNQMISKLERNCNIDLFSSKKSVSSGSLQK